MVFAAHRMQSQPSRPNVLHPEKLLPMSMVHVNGVAVLCVHVASEKEDLCQEATRFLQYALSEHTNVTGFVREIDHFYVGVDSAFFYDGLCYSFGTF